MDIDEGRVVWIRAYGVPVHAWSAKFFVKLVDSLGSFICLDESTSKGTNLDIARFMVRVPLSFRLSDNFCIQIDGK